MSATWHAEPIGPANIRRETWQVEEHKIFG